MKILAIRGQNLASLEQEFELDLEASPLGGAGLFAITGPTGSGKTTLLDSMCLALFDTVPRYRESNRYQQGDSRDAGVSSVDARNILRLGAVEGYAEVDFRGREQKKYRARWEVRRARNQPSGRQQAQKMSLIDLETGELFGDTRKTETLKLITEKLGLDFHQFCRSVLLAQGDFAAFLKAPPKDRALLLERITGTTIYSRLSQAAFVRHKQEKESLEELERSRDLLQLLPADEEQKLRADQAEAERDETELSTLLKEFERDQAFYKSERELRARLDEAQADLLGAKRKRDSLLGQDLEALIAAQPLRANMQSMDSVNARLVEVQSEKAQVDDQRIAADAAHQLAHQNHSDADKALTAQRQQQQSMAPDLLRARDLEASLAVGQRDLKRVAVNQAEQRTALDRAEWELELLRQRGEVLQASHERLNSWITEHGDDALLCENWTIWKKELAAIPAVIARLNEAQAALPLREVAYDRAQSQFEEAQRARVASEQARDEAQIQADKATAKTKTFNQNELSQALKDLSHQRVGLEKLIACHRKELDLLERKRSLRAELAATDQAEVESEQRREQLADQLRQMTIRLQEAEHALRLSEAACELGARRAELLRQGDACPLCGATDHPWQDRQDPLSQAISAHKQRVQELRNQDRSLTAEDTNELARMEHQRQQRTKNRTNLATINESLGQLCTERDQLLTVLESPPPLSCVLENTELQLAQELAEIGRKEQLCLATQKEAETARGEAERSARSLREARAAFDRAGESSASADRAKHRAERELTEVRTLRETVFRAWQERLDRLAPIFRPQWSAQQLESDPAAFQQHYQERVTDWRKHQEEIDLVNQERNDLDKQTATTGVRVRERREQLQPKARAHQQQKEKLAVIESNRKLLFEGRTVATMETLWKQQLDECEQALAVKQRQVNEADKDRHALSQRAQHLAEQVEKERELQKRVAVELAKRLQQAGLEESVLRAYLEQDPAWVEQQQRALQQARELVTELKATLTERQERLEKLLKTTRPQHEERDVAERITQTRFDLEQAIVRKHRGRIRLEGDRVNREKSEKLLPKLEQQRAQSELWAEMNKLIGSRDGTRFRKYAQGLTLEVLVRAANEHLRDLQPRYLLRRPSREELELEIMDLDMGDEIRTLAGLSGGETFLVSLALALGLATLNAEGIQIESLFIDEGFGVLDAQALESALVTLEMLQASGRQVGIISHVSTVADRVDCRIQVVRRRNGSSVLEYRF